jgi:hypothetical protein
MGRLIEDGLVTPEISLKSYYIVELVRPPFGKELYEWISFTVLSNSVSKEFLQGS